jgi:hypothetical protein
MNRNRFTSSLVALTLSLACASEAVETSTGGGATTSTGGAPTSNGGGGAGAEAGSSAQGGGLAGTGGSGGSAACDDPATPCFDQSCLDAGEPYIDPTLLGAPCGEAICGVDAVGRCLDESFVPAEQLALFEACSEGKVCVPDRLIATNGNPEPQPCSSIAGAEGRCLSRCLPDVQAQEASAGLPADVCSPGDVCVPCFNPLDGSDTGACRIGARGCDAPIEPPVEFLACCADKGGGRCIPLTLAGPTAADSLDAEECTALGAADSVCVPTVLLDAQAAGATVYEPPVCNTLLSGEGRCLPTCIPDADSFLFGNGDCESDTDNCVPCELLGQDTGSCAPIEL